MITGDLSQLLEQMEAERVPFVTATVVRAASPTSVRPGDSALVLADGTIEGFVGGVCAQSSVRLHAARALETGEPVILRLMPGTGDGRLEDGVVVEHNPCLSGGSMDIFLEPRLPPARIVVAGETPIARAFAELARAARYDVVQAEAGDVEPRESDSALVVASHGEGEEALLARALEAGVGYVALVASPKRGAAVLESLEVADALREQVCTPAGLDIGARTPEEIAIAILAEFVAKHVPRPLAAVPQVQTAVDPVCGMTVTVRDGTMWADVGGERFWFCSEGCRKAYVERSVKA